MSRLIIGAGLLLLIGLVIGLCWLFSDAPEDVPDELAYGDWPAVPRWDSDTLSDARDWN